MQKKLGLKKSKNSNEIKILKFQMNKQREKIATQTEIIHELGSKMEKLKSRPLRKTLLFKNAKHN